MRWFKHFSDARHDEFMTWLRVEYGMEGVGRWWTIVEVVAEQMQPHGSNCSAKHPWVEWCSFLKQKRNKLSLFLKQIENKSKINLVDHGNILEIEIPKMLELRDNYSRNLQGGGKRSDKKLEPTLSSTSSSAQRNNKLYSSTIDDFPSDRLDEDNPFGQVKTKTGEVLQ